MAQKLFLVRRIIAIAGLLAIAAAAQAITISINYQYDTQGFFDSQPRRDALHAAADTFRIFTDNLTAINPGTRYNIGTAAEFVDTWTATFEHPSQAGTVSITNLAIPANTVVIYAGGKNLSGNTLGFGGPGGYTVNGISGFVNAVTTRGQANSTGAAPTDFGRWGGGISFDTTVAGGQPRVWHTDLNTLPPSNSVDLYTVAIHELGHLFGFALGTIEQPLSFQTNWNQASRLFTGSKVQEVYGGPAPTAADGTAHWDASVTSLADGVSQLTVLGPNIPPGERRRFTALDYAALADIGWQVPDSVFATPVPGDYDGNRIVNAADYSAWRNHYWSTTNLSADGNHNNRVDLPDYTIWRDHRGATGGAGSGAALVPEPAGLVLGSIGSLGLMAAVHRRLLRAKYFR